MQRIRPIRRRRLPLSDSRTNILYAKRHPVYIAPQTIAGKYGGFKSQNDEELCRAICPHFIYWEQLIKTILENFLYDNPNISYITINMLKEYDKSTYSYSHSTHNQWNYILHRTGFTHTYKGRWVHSTWRKHAAKNT